MFNFFQKLFVPAKKQKELTKETKDNFLEILNLAVYRMEDCPLMAYLLELKEENPIGFEDQKKRYIVFTCWSLRRAIYSYCGNHPQLKDLIQLFDFQVSILLRSMIHDENFMNRVHEAFERFDEAIVNESQPGWVYWLGNTVLAFILKDSFYLKISNPEILTKAIPLPALVLGEIHEQSQPRLSSFQ